MGYPTFDLRLGRGGIVNVLGQTNARLMRCDTLHPTTTLTLLPLQATDKHLLPVQKRQQQMLKTHKLAASEPS